MTRDIPTLYKLKRGLKKPLRAFDYRELKHKILGWETKDDCEGFQTTLEMYR